MEPLFAIGAWAVMRLARNSTQGGQCESGNCLNAVLPRRANYQVFNSTAKWQPQARHVGERHLNALRAIGRRYGHVRAITDVLPKFGTEAAYV